MITRLEVLRACVDAEKNGYDYINAIGTDGTSSKVGFSLPGGNDMLAKIERIEIPDNKIDWKTASILLGKGSSVRPDGCNYFYEFYSNGIYRRTSKNSGFTLAFPNEKEINGDWYEIKP